jgi:hypothetical protein
MERFFIEHLKRLQPVIQFASSIYRYFMHSLTLFNEVILSLCGVSKKFIYNSDFLLAAVIATYVVNVNEG